MNWMQKMAWEEAYKLLSRGPKQHKNMGFATFGEAATFEFKRVAALAEPKKTEE